MSKLRVRMLQTQSGPIITYKSGGVYELDEKKAKRFISMKIAEPVDPKTPTESEIKALKRKAAEKKAETAVKKK